MNRRRSIDFERVASVARSNAEAIVARWLPGGRRDGVEWVARNPKRADAHPGSFKCNMRTGKWSDFATGDRGGDLIALAAYLFDLRQDEAAQRLAEMLGINPYDK